MSTKEEPSDARGEEETPYRVSKLPSLIGSFLKAQKEEYASGNRCPEETFDIGEFCHANDDWEPYANTSNPADYGAPKHGNSPRGSFSQPRRKIRPNDEVRQHRVQNYAEDSSLGHGGLVHVAGLTPAFEPHLPSVHSDALENSSHMHTIPYYARDTVQIVQRPGSEYEPYRARFNSSESASKHRKEATRFNRQPYRPPDSDYTIAEVERDRLYHVERVYNAMTCGNAARDNKGSIAMKRWVHGAYYDSGLVEAYAHKVLDCLLLQAKDGFRGWVHNDYVADDRKGDDEDRDVTCKERLESILRALQEEKTICEDVMNSACQIRMFVNAPKAYANRKYQNRVGNSKRGRAKDFDTGEGPSKVRRLNPKPSTKARRTVSIKLAGKNPHARPESVPREMSPFQRSQAIFPTPSALTGSPNMFELPRPNPLQDTQSALSRIHAISPPLMGSPYVPRVSTMPPQQHAPLMSPPALTHGNNSAPASPDNVQLLHDDNINLWSTIQQYDDVCYQREQSLFDRTWSSPDGRQGQTYNGLTANLFAQHPEPTQVALSPRQQIDGVYDGQNFTRYWEVQQGVQQLPYPGTPETHDQI